MTDLAFHVLALLFLASVLAGFIDSIAGGGGLIAIPAMLIMGIPPLEALGTNKLSAQFGAASATLSYARGVEDSARVCDEYKAAHSSEHAKETKCSFLCHEAGRWTAANQAAAAIRSLIPNTPKV